jgi:diguanylate cyclase (GGDEF)-like protein
VFLTPPHYGGWVLQFNNAFMVTWTLVLVGSIRYFPAVEYFQTFGFVVEVTLLSVALAERINRERRAREVAQQRTVELEKTMDDLASANAQLERLTEVDSLTQQIRNAIQELAMIYEGKTIRLTASIGLVGQEVGDRDTVDSLVDMADKALYQAKENGRNRVETAVSGISLHHKQ